MTVALPYVAACASRSLGADLSSPHGPIRFIVPFAPGGSTIVARSVADRDDQAVRPDRLRREQGRRRRRRSRCRTSAKAAPDGHTLILGHVGTLAVNPFMLSNQPYDVNQDFIPITMLAKVPNIFVVHPDVPAKYLKEFVALAKADPGQAQLCVGRQRLARGTWHGVPEAGHRHRMTHIPYRGTGPQMTDLLAGRIQAALAGLPRFCRLKDGKLRPWRRARRSGFPCCPMFPPSPRGLSRLRDLAVVRRAGTEGYAGTVVNRIHEAC